MAPSGTRAPLGMPLDVYRAQDGSHHLEADLPAVDPDSVEVTVEHSTLTIRAERTPHYGESEQVIVAERPHGSFTRQLSLGEGVDSENLTVGYADGVLHVTIPASPKAQARRVEITRPAGGSRTISGSTVEQGEAPAGRCRLNVPVTCRAFRVAAAIKGCLLWWPGVPTRSPRRSRSLPVGLVHLPEHAQGERGVVPQGAQAVF
jgi:HSP20 family protein